MNQEKYVFNNDPKLTAEAKANRNKMLDQEIHNLKTDQSYMRRHYPKRQFAQMLEYGVNDKYSLGFKVISVDEVNFLNKHRTYDWFQLFQKIKIYQNAKYMFSVQPSIMVYKSPGYSDDFAADEKLYLTEVLYNYGLITRDDIIDSYSKYFSLLIVDQIENYRIKDHSTLDSYCNDGYFLGYDNHNQSVVVVNNIYMVHKLLEQEHQILLAHAEDFYAILEGSTKALSSVKASHYLGFLYPGFTAGSINYKKIVACGAVVFSFLLLWCIKLFLLMSNFIFFVQNFFKLFLCLVSWLFKIDIKKTSELENYPAYTILLPVYKEASQLENLVHYISNLIYPKSQLDVKLIVEEDDYTTLEKIKDIELPDYFHIIKVPYSFPRTKPKAMNYAMEYARGEYVAIYDADDRPDADQLIKALSMFRSLPEEYICVQAKLNYYNKDENLLTKLFSIEYSI